MQSSGIISSHSSWSMAGGNGTCGVIVCSEGYNIKEGSIGEGYRQFVCNRVKVSVRKIANVLSAISMCMNEG